LGRLPAELARGTAGAVEHDVVLPIIVEVNKVSLPALRFSGRAPLALLADKLAAVHRSIIARSTVPV
jgi:hypothetical protein